MAKYVIDTELNNRALSSGIRGINQQMNSLTRSAREFNKEFEKSGKKSDKKKAMQDMAQAISLADEKVKKLTADLEAMEAKGNIKGINKTEADLRNAKTQAAALRREMDAMNKSAGGGATGFARLKAAKDAAMNSKPVKALSASFKGLSAVASGSATVIKTGFNGIAKAAQFGIGTLAKISGTAAAGLGLLGKSAMGTYDEITRGNRAMTNSLSDGAKGANEFQGEIKKLGSAGLADMGSLTDIAKNLSSSLNLSGKEAFKMSTNILDIGTAFGMSKDKIENFGLVSSQIFSAGKLMAQDYNQLIDSGAAGPIKKWIAAHNDAGITMDNFKEKVNNGEVSADLYRKAIESLGADFKGAGQDVQTFGDAFENSMKSLDMSFIESMKKEFGSLGFTLSDMSNNMSDFTTQIGEAAAAFLGGAWQAVSPFVAQLQEGFEGLSFSASDIARIMGVDLFTALGNLIPNMAQVQVFSDLLKGAWDLLMGVLTQITSLINVFVNALMEGAGWLGETGGATEKVNEDFALLQGVLGTLSAALQPIIQFLGTLVGQLISGAVQLLSWIDKSGLLTSVIQFLGSIIEGVVNVVKALVNGFMEAAGLTDKNSKASKRLSDIVDGLKRIWEMLVPVLSKIAHVIGNVIGVIFNIITAIGQWVANNKVLETALGILLRGIENFVNIASGFLDTIRGIAKAIGDAWNAIFKSADEQQEVSVDYNVSSDIEDEPDPFAGLADIQYFTKASGVMDALNSAMGSFRGATMASKTTGATTYGDFNVTIDGAQNPQAVMNEFKGLMRKNGYPLRFN
jgi:tape measure domain-containing protein